VHYKIKFTGTLDGAGYTISDLFINRPTEDYVGLFGYTYGATIEDVELKDADITGDDRVSGLVGYSTGGTISRCLAGGTISGDDYVGSLGGWIIDTTISQCYGTGSVTGGDDYVGGLIGVLQACAMSNCYSRASATGDRYVGGLVGYSYSSETITNSHSTGTVIGNTDVGGLLGYSEGTITNCFWDTITSGQATSDGGTGKATADMQLFATFYPLWDIGHATASRNDGYPFLSWEIDESATIWLIMDTHCITIPDIPDGGGRVPKGARVEAYRVDTHTLVGTQYLDANGVVVLSGLPAGVDMVGHVSWGGIAQSKTERWFFLQHYDIEEGGTGGISPTTSLSLLGLGTEDSPQFTAINLGHASDTTITRVAPGRIAIESVNVVRTSQTVSDNEVVRFSGTTGDLIK